MTTAYLSYSVDVDCPHCDTQNDISKDDADAIVANAIFNNNWSALEGYDVTCYECKKEFIVEKVEY